MKELYLHFIESISLILQWFFDLVLYFPKEIFSLYLEGLATVFENIEVPDIVTQFTIYMNQFMSDSGVAYFVDLFQLREGFAILLSAYMFALLIRLLPGVG